MAAALAADENHFNSTNWFLRARRESEKTACAVAAFPVRIAPCTGWHARSINFPKPGEEKAENNDFFLLLISRFSGNLLH